jgi:hypothetical protein
MGHAPAGQAVVANSSIICGGIVPTTGFDHTGGIRGGRAWRGQNAPSNYEVSATPCTESETEQAHREALQKPCCTKPRATSRAYGDLTATGAAVGWNCPAFARRIASNTTV